MLDFTFKQDTDPLSMDSVIEQLGSQFDLTGMEDEIDYLASEYNAEVGGKALRRQVAGHTGAVADG